MNFQKPALRLFVMLVALPFSIVGQAIVENDTVYYPEVHPVDYDQVVYKTGIRIDEWAPVIEENLSLRVYYPTDLALDEQRPTIVFIHGGGFIGGSYSSFFDAAEGMAQLGYIAVSIQYRLCQRNDCLVAAGLGYPCNIAWGVSLFPSAYVAALDAADAIRWLQDHATDYHIDPDQIVVGGHSAGAWTSLLTTFVDQDEINEVCSGCGTWPDYLADSIDSPNGIRGVLNMSGAILDTTWIDPEEADIDVMTIHGTHDGAVHYGTEPVYPCCGTYAVSVEGACPITSRLNNLSGNTYLSTGQGYGHDVFETSWWDTNGDQILWFLGKVFFDDAPYQTHISVQRDNPLQTCSPPFTPIDPASACGLPISNPKVVLFEQVTVNTLDVKHLTELNIYPNPADGYLALEMSLAENSQAFPLEVTLFNELGNNILHQKISQVQRIVKLSIGDLPDGVYFLRLQTNEGAHVVRKIIIAH